MRSRIEKAFGDEALLWALRIASAAMFLGYAWLHLFWDPPYRVLLWDERLMKGLVEGLTSMTWHDYATSVRVERGIQTGAEIIGVCYLVFAAAALRAKPGRLFERAMLVVGSIGVAAIWLLAWKDRFYQHAQLLESTIQVSTPLMLVLLTSRVEREKKRRWFLNSVRVATAATFAGHGLYAIGYYPVPGNFQTMVVSSLGLGSQGALAFLKVAGILDFAVAAALVFPGLVSSALAYAAFWGTATALARVVAHVSSTNFLTDLHQWLPETFVRLPHGFLPLAALVVAPLLQFRWRLTPTELPRFTKGNQHEGPLAYRTFSSGDHGRARQ